jgi:hypothetical protein
VVGAFGRPREDHVFSLSVSCCSARDQVLNDIPVCIIESVWLDLEDVTTDFPALYDPYSHETAYGLDILPHLLGKLDTEIRPRDNARTREEWLADFGLE